MNKTCLFKVRWTEYVLLSVTQLVIKDLQNL